MEVRDHGHGLAPAAIPHVFDRLFKADTARARSEGSGLGLAIAGENACPRAVGLDAGLHGHRRACTAVTSARATTRTAARYSP